MRNSLRILIYILTFSLILILLIGCGNNNEYEKYSYEFFGTFDTIVQIMGYSTKEIDFNKYAKYTHNRFEQLHELFDIYNDYDDINNIKTINDNAGIKPVKVKNEIIKLLEFCMESNKNISNKVNIAMGPVLKIWHIYRREGMSDLINAQLPPIEELETAAGLSDINDIIIDKKNSTVFLAKKGMSLDVGAVAKGFATEIVSKELKEQGFTSFLLSSGGNVKAVGAPLDDARKLWSIGLQNPYYFSDMDNEEALIDTAYIENNSVVSSGDYQRFYYVNGIRYHHIIDTDTLMPADYYSAVTIITKKSDTADFLSTAIFLMPYDKGRIFVESLDGVEAYWIFKDGTIKATDKMTSMLKKLGGAVNQGEDND